MQYLQLVAMQTLVAGVTVGLWLLAWQLFKFLGVPWLILLWPVFAAISHNRNRSVEAIAIWHAVAASYIAWGLLTGFWYPPHRSQVALFDGPAWLPWAGWGVWTLSVLFGLLAGVLAGGKAEDRFSSYALVPWPMRHRQASYVLAFFGLWMIGYGGHSILVPLIVTTLGAYQGSEIFGDSASPKPTNIAQAAPGAAAPDDEQARTRPETPVVNAGQKKSQADSSQSPAERAYPPDDGSPDAASRRELAALRRAAVSQWLAETGGRSTEQHEHRQAQWAALDDAKRWALAVRARVKQAVQVAVRPDDATLAPPLTKNVLPALLPLTYPADFRALERWASRVGVSVYLPGRPARNPACERWPEQRIDNELPALALPEAAEVWLRTRALLWPESWPTDDDWVLEDESPDLLLRHSDAQFAIVKDGLAAIPARLVDVADLPMLEEVLGVGESWTARQEAGQNGANVDERQTIEITDADRRLIARHAFRIGTTVWFHDGTESNPNGERWAQATIDARLPPLSANRGTQTTS